MAILFILFALFGFVFLGFGSGLTGSSSSGSGRAGPPPKCAQHSSADTNKPQHCRGANP
jgi:hypothetical protein